MSATTFTNGATPEHQQIEQAIAHLEGQRAILGDATVNTAVTLLRDKLATLPSAEQPTDAPAHLAPRTEQRKIVTILFADLYGLSELTNRLDPEEVRDLLDRYVAHVTPAIQQYGGVTEKFIGDAVMAVFGIPVARENDPENAVRAALAMQQAVQDLTGPPGLPLALRVGICTGPVLAAFSAGEDFSLVGDAVNVASRLEQAAPPGGVLIAHDTYRHVRGLFHTQALAPLMVKGKPDPLHVYLVHSARPRGFEFEARSGTSALVPLIGREKEVRRLQQTLRSSLSGAITHIATVVGEAGLGKSRLIYEFSRWVESEQNGLWFFKGRATPEYQLVPYALIRDLFASRFGIQDSDSASVMRTKFEQGFAELYAADSAVPRPAEELRRRAHLVGRLIGFDFHTTTHLPDLLDDGGSDNSRRYQQALAHLTDFMAHVGRTPAVVFFEDIHWADDRSLDLIRHWTLTCPQLRVLVICTARPTLFERRPEWDSLPEACGEFAPCHTRVTLQPLSDADVGTLAQALLHPLPDLPTDLRTLIVSAAEGNPFYVEELIKVLFEDGVIMPPNALEAEWRVDPTRLAHLRVPSTLTGVLQARLDALPSAERETLQRAAVIGRVFWDSAVAALNAQGDGTAHSTLNATQNALTALCRRELVFMRSDSTFSGTREYIIKHSLLRDVAYESVLKRRRRQYHAQAAHWLAATVRGSERVNEYAALIAEHYERGDANEEALEYLCRAGEQALRASALHEATAFFQRGLTLLADTEGPVLDAWRVTLTRQLGESQTMLGEYDAAERALNASLALAQARGDQRACAASLNRLGVVQTQRGEYREAKLDFEAALAIVCLIDDRMELVNVLRNLGNVAYNLGLHTQAKDHYQESLATARLIGDRAGIRKALNNLGRVTIDLGEAHESRRYLDESLTLARQLGDRVGIAQALANLGQVASKRGAYTEAQAFYRQSLTLREQIGDRLGEAMVYYYLGEAAQLLRAYQEAQTHYERARTLWEGMGYKWGLAVSTARLGHTLHEQGRTADGEALVRTALALTVEINALPKMLFSLCVLARIFSDTQRAADAVPLIAHALLHPATDQETKALAQAVLVDLHERVPAAQLAAGLSQGRHVVLEDLLQQVGVTANVRE